MFRHPKYYKELRKRNKSDQVISGASATAPVQRAPGPGLQQVIEETVPHNDIEEASSDKQTRTSSGSVTSKPQASSDKLQAQNNKPQASSLK